MGKIITPAVKRHIGATIIRIDSKDINLISNYLTISSNYFFSHAYLYLNKAISLQLYILLSKNEKKIKYEYFFRFIS